MTDDACECAERRGHTCDSVTAPTLWCVACWPRLSAERLTPEQIASYSPGEHVQNDRRAAFLSGHGTLTLGEVQRWVLGMGRPLGVVEGRLATDQMMVSFSSAVLRHADIVLPMATVETKGMVPLDRVVAYLRSEAQDVLGGESDPRTSEILSEVASAVYREFCSCKDCASMRDPDATYDCDEMWPDEAKGQCPYCGLEVCEKPHECQDGLDEDAIARKGALAVLANVHGGAIAYEDVAGSKLWHEQGAPPLIDGNYPEPS